MRGGMRLSVPPFTRAVRNLIIANTAIVFLLLIAPLIGLGAIRTFVVNYLYLVAGDVLTGRVWQLVTYGFLHVNFTHLLFNMFALWMFGSQFEVEWGRRKFLEFYYWCLIGAAVTTVVLAVAGALLYRATPLGLFRIMADLMVTPTAGASGGIYGLLIAFGLLYGDREIFMFPLPFTIKARYMVAIWIAIALVGALGDTGGVANFAHLGGAMFGWIYLRFLPSRGLGFATSEGYYGIRNRYYRWKRKQAQKKFEVYMSKHKREDYFDEYGNYKEPRRGDRDKGNGDPRGPWVN